MPRQKALNQRQSKFCRLFTSGETAGNIAQSHRKAGYICPTIEGHGGNGLRLLRSERIQKEIERLREREFNKTALSYAEKRAFLARSVRTSVSQVTPDSDLAQEFVEEVDQSGNVRRKVKMVDKMRCLELDNKMAGHSWADRSPQASNPFLLIVSLGKSATPSVADQVGPAQRLAQPQDSERIIDAEVIEESPAE